MDLSEIRLNRLRLRFRAAALEDVEASARAELETLRPRVKPGMRIAVAVGSRGIRNLDRVTKTVVETLKAWGAAPFIIPAMGSHGGATAEGQREVLAGYGVTEKSMGAPVCSSMAVERIGVTAGPEAVPVYMDRFAWNSDGVIVINRVKAHTDFHGVHESGILKILVIGLGKHAQALAIHAYMVRGLRELIPQAAEVVLRSGKILGAVGLVEDGYDQTALVRAVCAEDIPAADAELLRLSKTMLPALPWDALDVLVVDQIGKDVSGTGMDPNIVGRVNIRREADGKPDIMRICLLGLTEKSHGNGLGVGLADVIPQSLYEQIDWPVTYENVLTSRFLERGFTPIVRPTERQAVETAVGSTGQCDPAALRLVRIRDTLHISQLLATDVLTRELAGREDVEVLERGIPLSFDGAGRLTRLAGEA